MISLSNFYVREDYNMNSNIAAILGALIGDSATLGLHWIYDPKRISEIEKSKGLVFLQPDA